MLLNVGSQWGAEQEPCPVFPSHVDGLLTSPFPAPGTFLSHERRTAISVPFYSQGQKRKAQTPEGGRQVRAVCPDREGYCGSYTALQEQMPPRTAPRQVLSERSHSGPSSVLRTLFSETYLTWA